jgi:hypothetical protein
MNREITIEIEKLIGMFIIARGTPIGVGFTYHPKLPKPIAEGIDFQTSCGCLAKFLSLRVNSKMEVECWFIDSDGDTFSYGLKEVKKSQPFLYVAIFTHVFDMIENIDM